jgi:hypothetical protein
MTRPVDEWLLFHAKKLGEDFRERYDRSMFARISW